MLAASGFVSDSIYVGVSLNKSKTFYDLSVFRYENGRAKKKLS